MWQWFAFEVSRFQELYPHWHMYQINSVRWSAFWWASRHIQFLQLYHCFMYVKNANQNPLSSVLPWHIGAGRLAVWASCQGILDLHFSGISGEQLQLPFRNDSLVIVLQMFIRIIWKPNWSRADLVHCSIYCGKFSSDLDHGMVWSWLINHC